MKAKYRELRKPAGKGLSRGISFVCEVDSADDKPYPALVLNMTRHNHTTKEYDIQAGGRMVCLSKLGLDLRFSNSLRSLSKSKTW